MAVRKPIVIKRATSGTLTLEAVEESFIIKTIGVTGAANDTDYFKVLIRDRPMAYIPAYLLPLVPYDGETKDFFKYIQEFHDDFPNFLVANGETFKIVPEGSYNLMEVKYEEHDPGDVDPTHPGGSLSEVKPFIVSYYNSGTISASGWYTFDSVLGAPEAPDFPVLARMPADRVIDVYAIAVHSAVSGSTKATYLRIWREEEMLFDPDGNGFSIDPTVYNEFQPYHQPSGGFRELTFMRFKEPFTLTPNTKYTFQYHVDYDGSNALPSKGVMMTLIGMLRPVR